MTVGYQLIRNYSVFGVLVFAKLRCCMITDYDKIDFSFTVYWLFRRISVDMEGFDANLGFINELN